MTRKALVPKPSGTYYDLAAPSGLRGAAEA